MDSLIPAQEHWSGPSTPPPSAATNDSRSGVDVLSLLKRYLILIVCCVVVGTILGVLNYFRTDPTYQSYSEVLVTNERSTTFSGDLTYGFNTNQKTIDTHVLIIQSPLIVKRALDAGAGSGEIDLLKEYPQLRRGGDPVFAVRRKLEVKKAGDWSNVMSLTYTADDRDECRDVLGAIVTAYNDFLTESSTKVGEETASLIDQAKTELLAQLKVKQQKYDDFRKTVPPLIWKDGKAINPHRERQMEVEQKRAELMVEHSTLQAKLDNMYVALDAKDANRQKAIYFEALGELQPDTNKKLGEDTPQRTYVAALTDEYAKLKAEEQSLATRFGEGHPDLMDIRSRLESLRATLGLSDEAAFRIGDDGTPEGLRDVDYITIYVHKLNDRLATIEKHVSDLDTIYEEERLAADQLQTYVIEDATHRNELQATQRLFDAVVSRLEEINIVRDHGGDSIDVLAKSQLGMQIAPVMLNNLVLGCFIGGMFGCGLGYLLDRNAAIFRSPVEIRNALNVPVIGRIPVIDSKEAKVLEDFSSIPPIMCTVHRHGSSIAEAYRAVRTSLFYSVASTGHRIIQVTSPLPGDGKSTLAANLAVTIAKSGSAFLLVDADFRRPTLHQLFGVESLGPGLVSVVRRETDVSEATIRTGIPNLSLLPVAERASNPAELLTNPEFKDFLEDMRSSYDFVLVDTPPVLAVTDPSAVAAQVDGVILVLRIRRGVQVAARRAREMLAGVDANVLGVVVNAVDVKSGYGEYGYGYGTGYGGYGYGYGYTTEEEEPNGSVPGATKRPSRHLTVGNA